MAKMNLDDYSLKERIVLLQEADSVLQNLQNKVDSQTEYLNDEANTVSEYESKLSELTPDSSDYYSTKSSLQWARDRLDDYMTRKKMLLLLMDIIKKTV